MSARPAFESRDFRREAEVLTIHNGEPFYVATCYELVEGRWEGFVSMRKAPVAVVEAPAPVAPKLTPAEAAIEPLVRHNWSRGEICSCGTETVICQGCGREVCGDVAVWVERPRDGDPGIARTGASSGGRYRSPLGNVGPCCSAKFGLGHAGTPMFAARQALAEEAEHVAAVRDAVDSAPETR